MNNPNRAPWKNGDFTRIAASMRENGRASDLQEDLEVLFNGQNKRPSKTATSIPATFLRAPSRHKHARPEVQKTAS